MKPEQCKEISEMQEKKGYYTFHWRKRRSCGEDSETERRKMPSLSTKETT